MMPWATRGISSEKSGTGPPASNVGTAPDRISVVMPLEAISTSST